MAEAFVVQPFAPPAGDPLAAEHAAVSAWVAAAMAARPPRPWGSAEVELKTLESGLALLAASPAEARRLVLAAVAQAKHWGRELARLRATGKGPNMQLHPAWIPVKYPRDHSIAVVGALMRRALPFEEQDLREILAWLPVAGFFGLPMGYVTSALKRYASAHTIEPPLHQAMRAFAADLRACHDKDLKRLATVVAEICEPQEAEAVAEQGQTLRPTPLPAPAGDPLILRELKIRLGMLPDEPGLATVEAGRDRFTMLVHSPLANEHALITRLLDEAGDARGYSIEVAEFAAGREMLALEGPARHRLLVAAAQRRLAVLLGSAVEADEPEVRKARHRLEKIVTSLAFEPLRLESSLLFDYLLYLAVGGERLPQTTGEGLFAAVAEATRDGAQLTEGQRFVLHLWRVARITGPLLGAPTPDIARLTGWIGDGAQFFLAPGERWSDALNADLGLMPAAQRGKWVALLRHVLTASAARPSDKWLKTAAGHMEAIGKDRFRHALERWLPLVAQGRTQLKAAAFLGDTRGGDLIHDENANALRGMLWMIPLLPRTSDHARMAAAVAMTAYRKIPGVGPRAVKVGNAAVYALSEMVSPESIGQLAMLKVRVRFGTAQKEVEKAFDAAAAALELPRDQIEEMSVPACGLETVGRRQERCGDYRAEVAVTGSDAELRWFGPNGKRIKAVPAAVKKDHAETVKEMQRDLKDLDAMLSAQRDRIDGLFLERKSWAAAIWRERYLDHPLVGTIARRLIWCVGGTGVLALDGQPLDLEGKPVTVPAGAQVTLWHPAGRSVDEVVAWRRRIEALGVVQPFKQAHREVYLLTGAERRTGSYSNRFAAHILRQHQFSALCAARRWKNKLRLMVDDEYPPASRELTAWGLRAEFWIEGIGDGYGTDTNESGVYLRLASDQVRFYRIGAAANSAHAGGGGYSSRAGAEGDGNINAPLPLEQIPPLVLSEVMRDIDLFVGVASIGNDPTWQDGGPANRYQTYWTAYSFGELSGTAVTRREALTRLIPRLKIAGRCTLSDRFLLVRGSLRTYKIHLGSGNILMEPNDQYLCIVPDARTRAATPQVYLPFEGDATLSIILSKAFLLADDAKIKDPLILRQLDRL